MSSKIQEGAKVIYLSGFRPQQPAADKKPAFSSETEQKEFKEKVSQLAAEIRSFEDMLAKLKKKK